MLNANWKIAAPCALKNMDLGVMTPGPVAALGDGSLSVLGMNGKYLLSFVLLSKRVTARNFHCCVSD